MTEHEPRTRIFSLRLTPKERAQIERDANGKALGDYIRRCVLKDTKPLYRWGADKPLPMPSDQIRMLAQVLGMLGKRQIFGSLKTLADAARLGALPVTQETEQAIQKACHAVVRIKSTLMSALGIKES